MLEKTKPKLKTYEPRPASGEATRVDWKIPVRYEEKKKR